MLRKSKVVIQNMRINGFCSVVFGLVNYLFVCLFICLIICCLFLTSDAARGKDVQKSLFKGVRVS